MNQNILYAMNMENVTNKWIEFSVVVEMYTSRLTLLNCSLCMPINEVWKCLQLRQFLYHFKLFALPSETSHKFAIYRQT